MKGLESNEQTMKYLIRIGNKNKKAINATLHTTNKAGSGHSIQMF